MSSAVYSSSIVQRVEKCWSCIEKPDSRTNHSYEKTSSIEKLKPKIVRVFVSSTFTDFNSERETLLKNVRYIFT